MPPSAAQIAAVRAAVAGCSSLVIRNAALDIRAEHLAANRWLAQNNRYARRTVDRLTADFGAAAINASHLTRYIAASTFIHCFDGWAFLSDAVDCLMDGDVGAAVHLAYYAELRAVMSFLASEGFGVFRTRHFWLDAAGASQTVSNIPTHDVVWLALREWATVPNKGATLLELIRVGGRTIRDWLNGAGHVFGAAVLATLAADWLDAWSLDLVMLADDHLLRNEVSYRPQGIDGRRQRRDLKEVLSAVTDYWRACEPVGNDRFQLLDLHLLRLAIERTFQAQHGHRARGAAYTAFLQGVAATLAVPWHSLAMQFLRRASAPTRHPLFSYARQQSQAGNSASFRPLPMIARALLLLRLAAAACQHIVQHSGISSADAAFYWMELGNDIGLWATGNQAVVPVDLWADIPPVLAAVDGWRNATPNPCNVNDASQAIAGDLWTLKQFNRVATWGVGL
jgi:hypothetical protein